jgi:hypothetical protein
VIGNHLLTLILISTVFTFYKLIPSSHVTKPRMLSMTDLDCLKCEGTLQMSKLGREAHENNSEDSESEALQVKGRETRDRE